MLKSDVVFEGAIAQDYARVDFLSPVWQVIYQEAIRGHHILFSSDEKTLTRERATLNPIADKMLHKTITKKIAKIFKLDNLAAMKEAVANLKVSERSIVFEYYLRFIADCQTKYRRSLN